MSVVYQYPIVNQQIYKNNYKNLQFFYKTKNFYSPTFKVTKTYLLMDLNIFVQSQEAKNR